MPFSYFPQHYTANKFLFIDASLGSGLPCVLVSCKCDNPPPVRQLEPGTLGQLGGSFGNVDTRQTSASKPQTQKQCISIVLKAILTRSKGEWIGSFVCYRFMASRLDYASDVRHVFLS
jgi:hypothetical protein